MDIKSIQPTAVFKADLAIGQHIELEVEFVSAAMDVYDHVRKGEKIRFSKLVKKVLIDAVKGWDTTENGVPVPCTDENKQKHLPVMLGLMIADKIDAGGLVDPGGVLGLELLNFASDSENFLKNS